MPERQAQLRVKFSDDGGLEVEEFHFQDDCAFSNTVDAKHRNDAIDQSGFKQYLYLFATFAAQSAENKPVRIGKSQELVRRLLDSNRQSSSENPHGWRFTLFGPQWRRLLEPPSGKWLCLNQTFLKCSEMLFWLDGRLLEQAAEYSQLADRIRATLGTKSVHKNVGYADSEPDHIGQSRVASQAVSDDQSGDRVNGEGSNAATWDSCGWLFHVKGYRVAYIPLINLDVATDKVCLYTMADMEVHRERMPFRLSETFPRETRDTHPYSDEPSCRLSNYLLAGRKPISVTFSETSY